MRLLEPHGTPGLITQNSREEVVIVLGKFVDALRASVGGLLDAELVGVLTGKRRDLDESGEGRARIGPVPGLPGGDFFLLPRSRGKYQFVLENEAVYLEATTRPNLPALIVQFRSRVLYEHDLESLETIVDDIAGFFLLPGYSCKVSRFDLALDFQADGWELPDIEDGVTRARKKSLDEHKGTTPVCMTLGRRNGTLQVQIYNKTEELKESKKKWMHQIYRENDRYDASLPVWRVELRFFGKLLREMDVSTVADLSSGLGDLVRVVVGSEGVKPWVQITDPDHRDHRRDRRPAAPWWEEVSASLVEGMPTTGRVRVRGSRNPSREHTLKMVLAYSKKLAAWEKTGGLDFGDSVDGFLDRLKAYLLEDLNSKDLSWSEAVDLAASKLGGVTDRSLD